MNLCFFAYVKDESLVQGLLIERQLETYTKERLVFYIVENFLKNTFCILKLFLVQKKGHN